MMRRVGVKKNLKLSHWLVRVGVGRKNVGVGEVGDLRLVGRSPCATGRLP